MLGGGDIENWLADGCIPPKEPAAILEGADDPVKEASTQQPIGSQEEPTAESPEEMVTDIIGLSKWT
jgi:hypothetical protein